MRPSLRACSLQAVALGREPAPAAELERRWAAPAEVVPGKTASRVRPITTLSLDLSRVRLDPSRVQLLALRRSLLPRPLPSVAVSSGLAHSSLAVVAVQRCLVAEVPLLREGYRSLAWVLEARRLPAVAPLRSQAWEQEECCPVAERCRDPVPVRWSDLGCLGQVLVAPFQVVEV